VNSTETSSSRVVQVQRLDAKGRGVGQDSDGRAVLVHGGLPGEEVRVSITGGGHHRDHGIVSSISIPSPDRTVPFCEQAALCGGCALQHFASDAQRTWKTECVREALAARGLDATVVQECQEVGPDRGFRAKLLWMTETSAEGELVLGLFENHSHALVPLDACPVQDHVTESTFVAIRDLLRTHCVQESFLRALLLRSNGEEVQVVLIAHSDAPAPDLALLGSELVTLERVVGAFVNWTPSEGNALLGQETAVLAGRHRLQHQMEGFALEVSPASFFQTHLLGVEALVATVRSLAPERIERLVDLYSGAGLFAMAMAERSEQILAVERDGSSARDGIHNLGTLGREKVRMKLAGVEEHVRSGEPADLVILDPPRAGCLPGVVHAIAERIQPEVVLMVNCGLSGFARNAAEFVECGYRLDVVHPLDLFVHSSHVEMVSRLVRTSGPN